jgi:hypothetical protein
MRAPTMKLLLIAYYEAIEEEVMEVLYQAGVETYTKWTQVMGKGRASGPHFMSHVWPKGNNVLAVAVEDAEAEKIMAGVRALRARLGKEGVKAFLLPLEEMT